MINKLKYATISDIGVNDLIFYDPLKESECLEFCRENSISYLPSKDKRFVYKADPTGFVKVRLENNLTLNPYDRIFDHTTVKKFEKVDHNEIRFITEKSKIKGVVHIVDYNNENLQIDFCRAFYRFENNIRTLLKQSNYKNEDFIEWVKKQSEENLNDHDRKFWQSRYRSLMPEDEKALRQEQDKRSATNQFQTFYLKELLLFSIAVGILESNGVKSDSIGSLRNNIAHNKDFTHTIENEEGEFVYNFKDLKSFVAKANDFFDAYEYVEDRIKN